MDGEGRRRMSMTIELTEAEVRELERVLASYLSDLRMEIAATDAHDFKQALKARKVTLSHVLERLGPAAG
jgi:hypothetical protein